jgi:hypothetical protein
MGMRPFLNPMGCCEDKDPGELFRARFDVEAVTPVP